MSNLHNDVYDDGLNTIVNNGDTLHLLSADPGLVYANIATYTLGNKSAPTINTPENHTTGRKITIDAITNGTTTDSGTASYYAVIDSVNAKILASGPLDSNVSLTSGVDFTTNSIYIAIPAPTT
jgi:hypothetical protein